MWHLLLVFNLFFSCASSLNAAAAQPVAENLKEPALRDNKRSLTFSVTMGFLAGMYTDPTVQDEQHHSSAVIRPMAITVFLASFFMKDPQRLGYRKLSLRESWARAVGMHTMSYGLGFFSGQLLRVVVKTDMWNRAWAFIDEQTVPESAIAGLTLCGALVYAAYRLTRPQAPLLR